MSCTRECSGICIVTFSKCHKKRENFPTTATSPVQASRPAPQQQSQNQHHAQQQVAVTGQPTQPAPQRLRFSAAFSSPGEKKNTGQRQKNLLLLDPSIPRVENARACARKAHRFSAGPRRRELSTARSSPSPYRLRGCRHAQP